MLTIAQAQQSTADHLKMDESMNIQLGKTNSKVLVEKYLLEKCKERRKQMGRSEKHYQRHPLHKLAKERLVGVHGVSG